MKKLLVMVVGFAILASLVGCKSVNTSDSGSMNVYPMTVGPVDAYRPLYKVNEKTRIAGEANLNVLFGIFAWGDSVGFADNASIFANEGIAKYFAWIPNAHAIAAKAAFYNACVKNKVDAVVASRYEITTDDYLVFKKLNVKISGFPATMTGVETVKPMPYYIDGKGMVVVLDKFVVPHLLFDASPKKETLWLF